MKPVASHEVLADALMAAIKQPGLLQRLKGKDTAEAAKAEIGIDEDVRLEMLDVLNKFDLSRSDGPSLFGSERASCRLSR